jgi:hypothetical protein
MPYALGDTGRKGMPTFNLLAGEAQAQQLLNK